MPTNPYPEAIAHYPFPMQLFIKKIFNRIESGKNALIVVVGGTGSGKSYAGLSLLMGLYLYRYGKIPNVDAIMSHVTFKAKEFLENLNSPNLKKKESWLWDESGVDVGHKTHATIQNRVIGYLCQTFRNLQQVIIFTVPTVSFMDASVRKLLHYQLETRTIIKKDEMCIIKTKEIQYNVSMDKIYYHPIFFQAKKGMMCIREIGIPQPPKEYREAYELIKSSFTSDLNIRIQSQLERIDEKEVPNLKGRQPDILKCLQDGITSTSEIAKIIGCSGPTISKNFGYMRRKGININKYLGK